VTSSPSDNAPDVAPTVQAFDDTYKAALSLLAECSPNQIQALELYDLRRIKFLVAAKKRRSDEQEGVTPGDFEGGGGGS
jgi:hypothetical protein